VDPVREVQLASNPNYLPDLPAAGSLEVLSARSHSLQEELTQRIRSAVGRPVERFVGPAVLLATVWITDFLHFREFGLYEDDFTFIPQAISMDLAELAQFIGNYLVHLYGHGRPLSDSLISLFSFLGWRIAGLNGIYLFGYLIVALNALLFYSVLRRLGSKFFALIGGLAFALFPADTTQPFLTTPWVCSRRSPFCSWQPKPTFLEGKLPRTSSRWARYSATRRCFRSSLPCRS